MKSILKNTSAAVALLALVLMTPIDVFGASRDFQPQLVPVEPTHAFGPQGFDDNDSTQIVLRGSFRNTCYKVGPVKKWIQYSAEKKKGTIFIQDQAYFYSNSWCAEVIVPYVKPVEIGILPPGEFEIKIVDRDNASRPMGMMPVVKATTGEPDDFLYAPVTEVSVLGNSKRGEIPTLVLRGTFSNSCMRLKEVRTRMKNNIIEVLPIAELAGSDCREDSVPFETRLELRERPKGMTLVHVRSLNGQAVNYVVEL